jgi:hypothetical protein
MYAFGGNVHCSIIRLCTTLEGLTAEHPSAVVVRTCCWIQLHTELVIIVMLTLLLVPALLHSWSCLQASLCAS